MKVMGWLGTYRPFIDEIVELLAGYADLVAVHHDHIVACVHVRRKDRLVLAAKNVRDAGSETPKGLVFGIDHIPLALDIFRLGGIGFDLDHFLTPAGVSPPLSISDFH